MGSTLWSTPHAADCCDGSGRSRSSGTRSSSYGRPSRVEAIVNRTIAVCLEHRSTVAAQPAPPNSLHACCGQRALATRTCRPVAFSAVIGRVSMGAAGGFGAAPRVGGGPLAAPPAPQVPRQGAPRTPLAGARRAAPPRTPPCPRRIALSRSRPRLPFHAVKRHDGPSIIILVCLSTSGPPIQLAGLRSQEPRWWRLDILAITQDSL